MGSKQGLNNMGNLYYEGGATQDYSEAIKWYKKASLKGYAISENRLGIMYDGGKGVTKNYYEAMNWYKKAAEKGYDWAMVNIGSSYYYGQGVTKDYTESLKWYKKAAEKGNTTALNQIGMFYCEGIALPKDYKEAFNWFKKSADKGNSEAMINIANMYYAGYLSGGDKFIVLWLEEAAKSGHKFVKEEAYTCGESHYILLNYSKALEWYIKAYELGKKDVKYKIAEMYREGIGVSKDKSLAKEWENK